MDIREKIRAKVYDNKDPYPVRAPMTDSISENLRNKEKFLLEKKEWQAKCRVIIRDQFKNDLEEEFGLTHNQHLKVYDFAWEQGKSEGLMNVVDYYERIVEILEVEP